MSLFRLAISNLTTRRLRTVLTLAAVALGVSLVVAVTSGYKSAEAAIYHYLATYMGSVDVQITNSNDPRKGLDQSLIGRMRDDPAVQQIFGRLETETGLLDREGKPMAGRAAELTGVDRPADQDITRTFINQGRWFDSATGDVAVIDQQTSDSMKLNVGDSILLPGHDGKRPLKIVGICHKPAFFAERTQWIYVPLSVCQELTNRRGRVTRIMVQLKNPADDAGFAARWAQRWKIEHPELKFRLAREIRKEMDQQLEGVHLLNYLGAAVSMLSAAFIIFSTLSMGVTERQRTLAMLRAIGAWRAQIVKMVLGEAAAIGLAGALLGIPLGILWTWILTMWRADFFTQGLSVDLAGIAMAAGGSLLAAQLAALLPAWNASRVSPLEAMTPTAAVPSPRLPVVCAILGLALISIDSLTIFASGAPRHVKYYAHFFVGLPCLMLGFFLASPVIVWLGEKMLSRLAARAAAIQPSLLRQQISGGLWRSAGTGSALMVALAALVAMHTVGNSMLSGWRLPTRFPDIFIWTANQGLNKNQWAQLDQVEGVRKGQMMPMIIGTPGLPKGFLSIMGAAILPDATMYIGVDPNLALDMMHLEFLDGNAKDAAAALKKGRHLIVTEEFRVLKKLKLGDQFPLMTRRGLQQFTICGVVWSPGIDVMVSLFDLGRLFDQRTAATVFGSLDDAEKEFGWDEAYLFAANLEPGIDKDVMLKKVREQLGDKGWKAGDIRKIKYDIIQGFERLLLLLSTIAFCAMAVAALGVTNTVMASVRSRMWQFGVLRSVGVTRAQLLRLVMAEALLLALVGIVLGMSAGLLMSVNGLGMSRFMIGYAPPMALPWGMIAIGIAVTLAISLLASLWPAASVARADPLDLLQAGRSAI